MFPVGPAIIKIHFIDSAFNKERPSQARNGRPRYTSTLESCWGRSVAFLSPTFPSEKLIKKRKSRDSPWRLPFRRRFLALFFPLCSSRSSGSCDFIFADIEAAYNRVQSLKRIFSYNGVECLSVEKSGKWGFVSVSRVRCDFVADVYLKYRRLVSFVLMLLFELAMEKFRYLCMRPFYIQRIFRCRIGKLDGHIFIGHKRKCKTVCVYRCFILCIFRFSLFFLCTK